MRGREGGRCRMGERRLGQRVDGRLRLERAHREEKENS